MEDRLLQLFPDQVVQLKEYSSFINQPERIQITSQQDMNDYDPTTLTTYYNFRVNLPRPALNVKSLQLARVSIPNCVANIVDTELTFWYYALPKVSVGNLFVNTLGAPGALAYTFDTSGNLFTPGGALVLGSAVYFDSGTIVLNGTTYTYNYQTASAGNVPIAVSTGGTVAYWIVYTSPQVAALKSNYLRYVRLMPSNAQPELMELDGFTGGFNRTFDDYSELVTELTQSTIDDPLNGEPLLNNVVGTFKFVPNQIGFSLSDRFNKLVFTGLDTSFSYCPAASDDETWMEAAVELQQRDRQNTRFSFSGAIQIVQPWQPFRNLNLRLGFNYATYPAGDNFLNMIRPIPPFIASPPPLNSTWNAYDHVASGYADLVYSACCHLYTDVTGGSTVDSLLNKALLGTLPLNTPNLGVGFHSLSMSNPLTKIATQLNELYIEMRTDSGAPFYVGNNAIISLEIILTY